MANKPISTSPTTMGKHGRLREEEAARDKGVAFTGSEVKAAQSQSDKDNADRLNTAPNPYYEKARPAMPQKSGALAPEPVTLVGPMLLSDVQAALSDRYPHNDIHTMEGATIEVKVPTGVILVDFKAVNKCKNTAELRAYIDALPIQ